MHRRALPLLITALAAPAVLRITALDPLPARSPTILPGLAFRAVGYAPDGRRMVHDMTLRHWGLLPRAWAAERQARRVLVGSLSMVRPIRGEAVFTDLGPWGGQLVEVGRHFRGMHPDAYPPASPYWPNPA